MSTQLFDTLPLDWQAVLAAEKDAPYWEQLEQFLIAEWHSQIVYPPREKVFSAFVHTPFEQVKLLLLGQDPYHHRGQADGLSFSVQPGERIPPSLRNMYTELENDLGITRPNHGALYDWANQSVMLLNSVLTVREKQAASHKGQGWEQFTDAIIQALNRRSKPLVFLLWGGYAKKKKKWIDLQKHRVIEGVHPSPLSAHGGFFGSRPFSQVNHALLGLGQEPIDWQIKPLIDKN